MSRESTPASPIPNDDTPNPQNDDAHSPQNDTTATTATNTAPTPPVNRSNRPSRACTLRTAQRLYAAAQAQAQAVIERKPKKKEQRERFDESPPQQCSANSKIVTPLLADPPPSQLPRWSLRAMWELASVLNFLHVSVFFFPFSKFPPRAPFFCFCEVILLLLLLLFVRCLGRY